MQNLIETGRAGVDFSILIPVYNSEKSLPLVLEGVRRVFAGLNYNTEFVLVDDGSHDGSWEVIKKQSDTNGDITAIRLNKNVGHSLALKRGMEFCQGDWTLTMDDDMQHPPEEIPRLLQAINDDVDVIMGAYSANRSSVVKSIGAKFYQSLLRATHNLPEGITITSFRLIRRSVLEDLIHKTLAKPHAGFMILDSTDRVVNVPVEYAPRKFGRSGFSLRKAVNTVLDGIALNSTLPLKFIGLGGLLLSVSAILLGLFYLIRYFSGNINLSGFTTLVILITFFSGAILAAISVLGLYIMRLIEQSTFSPRYSVREIIVGDKTYEPYD